MNSLAHSFRTGNGRKTKWRGDTVHSLLQFPVNDGDRIDVSCMSASETRAQAIKLAVDRGQVRANGVLVPTVAIWTHTAPDVATLEVAGRRARFIEVWNAWSFEGVDSSWVGNAAMTLESSGSSHTIRCSDGLGEANFDDLVVRVDITSHA